jgi:hypothetical protein
MRLKFVCSSSHNGRSYNDLLYYNSSYNGVEKFGREQQPTISGNF